MDDEGSGGGAESGAILAVALCSALSEDGECLNSEDLYSEVVDLFGRMVGSRHKMSGGSEDGFKAFRERTVKGEGWEKRVKDVRKNFASFIHKAQRRSSSTIK